MDKTRVEHAPGPWSENTFMSAHEGAWVSTSWYVFNSHYTRAFHGVANTNDHIG